MTTDETTPLIAGRKDPKGSNSRSWTAFSNLLHVENRILIVGFLICLSFSFTQVPLLYVFHLMTCDEYYDHHPPFPGPESQKCSIDAIASETAKQFSLTGMSTTLAGTFNLFIVGWMVKTMGPRAALMIQTLIPAIRVSIQMLGLLAGKGTGMMIIQASQAITIFGGPAGYILVTNIIAGELVEPSRRTATFGKLQGAIMLGQGLGYLVGGMVGNTFSAGTPFVLALVSFLADALFVRLSLPYIPPGSINDGVKRPSSNSSVSSGPSSGFFAPLRILLPQRVRDSQGKTTTHYGVAFLCAGIFVGVLATDYAPLMIQMYATAAFDFDQADNGWLMSEFSFIRSIFLILLFPRIISIGRRMWRSTPEEASRANDVGHFDLAFLRSSLVVDGVLTTVSAFATKRWHIFLAASLVPFGSGSAPAAKGVITSMCPESQRSDALNAITLVENVARLSTQGLFGFIFSTLASQGKAYATFYCNAAIAVLAMLVLLFCRFPPPGSTLVDEETEGLSE